MSRLGRREFTLNRIEENRELNLFPLKLPSRFSGLSEIAFRRLAKCWLDFQLLNTGIGTRVIVVFYSLSSSYVYASVCWFIFQFSRQNFRDDMSSLLDALRAVYCNALAVAQSCIRIYM